MGSMKENARDRARRGRGRENSQRGRKNPNVKLTEAQVREIIRLVKVEGYSQERVAEQFGIVQPHVSRLVRGAAWSDLPQVPGSNEGRPLRKRQPPRPYNQGENHPSATVTAAQVMEIRALARAGVRQREIADRYGISAPQVNAISKQRAWKHLPGATAEEAAEARRRWDEQHALT